MSHIVLRHFARNFPKVGKLRKRRERRARAIVPSQKARLWYRAQLNLIVNELRRAGKAIVEALRPHWPATHDAEPPSLPNEIAKQKAKFKNIRGVGATIAIGAVSRNLDAVDTRLSSSINASVGVDIRHALTNEGPIAKAMQDATAANIDLISSIPEEYFDKLSDRITESWNAGERWESMVDDIAELGDVTESRAELISRDQTSKMNSKFNEVRQTSLGIEKYEWQTAGDDRVRESHAELDGQVFSWDDPPMGDDGPANPGEDINCRCVASPVFDLDEVEADVGAAEGEPEEFDNEQVAA